jgi:hypothetical protein
MDFGLERVNAVQQKALLFSSGEFDCGIWLIRAIIVRDLLQFRDGKFVQHNPVLVHSR